MLSISASIQVSKHNICVPLQPLAMQLSKSAGVGSSVLQAGNPAVMQLSFGGYMYHMYM